MTPREFICNERAFDSSQCFYLRLYTHPYRVSAISYAPHIVYYSRRLLLSPTSPLSPSSSHRRSILASFSLSYVSSLRVARVFYPHRRLHLIFRPPLSTVSLLRRTCIVDTVSAQPLSSSLSSNIEESCQAAFVVSSQPVSHDTCPSLFHYRYVAALVVETRVHDTVSIVFSDCIVISHRKRHAAGFGGAADDTRRRPLPAASSSSLSAPPKRSLYRRLSTVASSCVSAKLRKEVNDVWPAAS